MKKSHVPTAIFWAKQVASAMHYLHNRDNPFIHADLKADNGIIFKNLFNCKSFCIDTVDKNILKKSLLA